MVVTPAKPQALSDHCVNSDQIPTVSTRAPKRGESKMTTAFSSPLALYRRIRLWLVVLLNAPVIIRALSVERLQVYEIESLLSLRS